jgi:cytochrome b561
MTASAPLPSTKYTKVAIALHWVIAILVLFLLFPGEELIEVERGQSLADWGPTAHASLGMLVLILTVVRIAWRLMHAAPPLPPMPAWQVKATAALHGLLYVLMLAIPLFGWMALAPFGAERLDPQAVTFFRLFPLDVWPNLGGWTAEMHEIGGTLAKILVILHVLAALKHQFIDKDGLMRRMMFR